MANKDDIKNQQDLNKSMAETNRLTAEENKYLELGRRITAQTTEETRNLAQELRDTLGLSRQRNDYDKALLGLSRNITTQAEKNAVALGRNKEISKELLKDEKILEAAKREQLINAKGLNFVQLQAADKIAKAQIKRQDVISEIDELYEKLATADEVAAKKLKDEIKLKEDLLANVESTLDTHLKLADTDTQRLSLATQLTQQAQKNVEIKAEEVAIQQQITDKLGITGGLLRGASGLMTTLGFSSNSVSAGIEEAEKAMEKFADEATRSEKEVSRLQVAMKGVGPLVSMLADSLLDPAVIIGKVADSFFKVDKAAAKFQQRTGMSASALSGANAELATSVDFLETAGELTEQLGMNAAVALGPDIIAGAAALKNELGLSGENAGVLALNAKLSGTSMQGMTDTIQAATDEFNNTNDAAVSSTQVIRDMGKASKAVQAQFAGYPGGLAKAAAAARKVGMELKDIEGVMDNMLDFQSSIEAEMEAELLTGKELNLNRARELSLAGDIEGVSKELFKNAQDVSQFAKMNRFEQQSYAAALGMSRDQLAEMAIQKSMLVGMTDEEKAKLRGVTLEESKRMDVQEKLQASLDKLTQALAPMLDILVPIADLFGVIAKAIAYPIGLVMKLADSIKGAEDSASSFRGVLAGIVKLIAGAGILLLGKTIKDAFNPKVAGGFFKNLKENFKGIGGLKDKLFGKKGLTEGITPEVKPTSVTETITGATDKTVEASNAASKAEDPKSSGEKLKEFFTNLAAGLKEMASTKVVGGALALIPASIGLVAFIPGYFGAKLIERIDGPKLQEGLTGLATGLSALGTGKVMLGALALAIAAPAFVIAIAGIPGMIAIGSLGSTTSTGLTALSTGLQSMSSTYAGIGALALTAGAFVLMLAAIPGMLFVALTGSMVAAGLTGLATGLTSFGTAAANPLLWLGIAALGALGIAMIPLSYAIGLLAPAIEAFGTIITSVFNGVATLVGAVAAGFVTLMDSVSLEKVMNMALLGPALLSAAVGLTAFSAAMAAGSMASGIASFLTGGGLLSDLQTLVEMAGPLQSVATSLTAIAGALAGIGVALATVETDKLEEMGDLVMTTAFAAPAVAAAGAIGDMIAGITGSGGGEKSESNDKLIAKIDELIVAVKQGKNINMDGRRVGATLQLSASNT
jgi:hypothetical protein